MHKNVYIISYLYVCMCIYIFIYVQCMYISNLETT